MQDDSSLQLTHCNDSLCGAAYADQIPAHHMPMTELPELHIRLSEPGLKMNEGLSCMCDHYQTLSCLGNC